MLSRSAFATASLIFLTAGIGAAAAECAAPPTEPRTLVLVLDGVPLRLVQQARERGVFTDWGTPRPLVSTFPSVTNVAFTAMFKPFDVAPAGGYEVQFYDRELDRIVGGRPWGYTESLFAWRDVLDYTGTTVGGKLSIYTTPQSNALKEIDEVADLVLGTDQTLVLAHAGATDAMLHLRGDPAVVEFLVAAAGHLEELRRRHRDVKGSDLRIILLSDHGNTTQKVKAATGMRKKLKKAGLHPWPHLEGPKDVVAATFGLLNYGVLFTYPENARTAAEAMARHKAVEVAAWAAGPREIGVVSQRYQARIRWRDIGDERHYAYDRTDGDPLELAAVVEALRAAGSFDDEGFASHTAWLEASVDAHYPDAPRRLVESLDPSIVSNNASVIFSMKPGYAWGWKSAFASSFVWGGHLEGTHGGLDRDSSVGFLMSSDPAWVTRPAMAVTDVFEPFVELERCRRAGDAQLARHGDGTGAEKAPGATTGSKGN